jgi:hypothetical protein
VEDVDVAIGTAQAGLRGVLRDVEADDGDRGVNLGAGPMSERHRHPAARSP